MHDQKQRFGSIPLQLSHWLLNSFPNSHYNC
jgi:hypothetical protein